MGGLGYTIAVGDNEAKGDITCKDGPCKVEIGEITLGLARMSVPELVREVGVLGCIGHPFWLGQDFRAKWW